MRKLKNPIHVAPRQANFKAMIGSYLSGVVALLTQYTRGYMTLEGLFITAVLMLTPIAASWFGLPTSGDSSVRLAATLIESIRASQISDAERRKLEMIIMLSVGEWDKINTLIEQAHNGHNKNHPSEEKKVEEKKDVKPPPN